MTEVSIVATDLEVYYFSVVMINAMTKDTLWKEGFILAYGSSRLRVHHGRKAWQQVEGMVTGAGN